MYMDNRILLQSGEPDSSAAISYENTYSALELGEMMNQQPLDLLKLDIGYQTRWFDCDYIEEILSFVNDEGKMLMLMTLIVTEWRKKIAERHPHVAYRNPETKEFVPFVTDLNIKLDAICKRLLAEREQIQQSSLFRKQFMEMYSGSTQSVGLKNAIPNIKTSTNPPQFTPEIDSNSNYHVELSSLPESIRKKIIVSQQVFDVFVKQLNTDIWNTVLTNKGRYCDPLRFLCIKHEVVSTNMERDDFNTLLHLVVVDLKDKPSLVSSMGRCSFTSSQKIKSSLFYYDSPVRKQQEKVWQLIKDCAPLEEGLQPVYDAMEAEALMAKSEVLQV
jgi:hypothetical protein